MTISPRFLLLALACLAASAFAVEMAAPTWPLWDGHESIEQYAKRTNLPPTKTLDLGNGVNLEVVLIPAGKFVMGAPDPVAPKVDVFNEQLILVLAGAAAFALVVIIVVRSEHKRRRPQFSLRWLLVFVITVGFAMLGGFGWWDVAAAWRRYELARSYGSVERPAHEVTLTKPFYTGKYEVTQEQYAQVMGTNPSQFKGASLPVETVSWDDGSAFCKKGSEKTGQTVRLPTEAEWEFACRAGTITTYYTGDGEADPGRAAWYNANSKNTTHSVGQKTANAWGVYDMHGNVWEWCQDWLEEYKPGAVVDPQGPPDGQGRVLRGGSWSHHPGDCRSASRGGGDPGNRNHVIGFRVVVEVPPRTP
ncbi:MAG: formylglycine-generating enzyme family protein [Planctomycetota bacterium]|nr:formylglycine-generating enzyme family protein [Planctomycetota bacterium]